MKITVYIDQDGRPKWNVWPEKPGHIDIFSKAGMDKFATYEASQAKAISDSVFFAPDDEIDVRDLIAQSNCETPDDCSNKSCNCKPTQRNAFYSFEYDGYVEVYDQSNFLARLVPSKVKEEEKIKGSDSHKIIEAFGLETRVWTFSDSSNKYGCEECCNGDRCDEDCTAKYKGRREECPHCQGTGWIPLEAVTRIISPAPIKENTVASSHTQYPEFEKFNLNQPHQETIATTGTSSHTEGSEEHSVTGPWDCQHEKVLDDFYAGPCPSCGEPKSRGKFCSNSFHLPGADIAKDIYQSYERLPDGPFKEHLSGWFNQFPEFKKFTLLTPEQTIASPYTTISKPLEVKKEEKMEQCCGKGFPFHCENGGYCIHKNRLEHE